MTGGKLTAVSTLFLCTITATQALAQSSSGVALTLGYSTGELEDLDVDGTLLGLDVDYGNGPFTLDFDIAHRSLNVDEFDDTGTVLQTEILPKYWIGPSFGLGAYLAYGNLDSDLIEDINTESYGVEGTFRSARYETSVFLGTTNSDELVGEDFDVFDAGLRLRYDVSEEFSLFGKGVNSELSADGDVLGSAQAYEIGGTYDFGSGFSAFGSLGFVGSDELESDVTARSVGMSYNLNASGRPILLSGEYSSLSGDLAGLDGQGHSVSLGATVLLGDARQKRLPGSGPSRDLGKSDRNAIDALLDIGF